MDFHATTVLRFLREAAIHCVSIPGSAKQENDGSYEYLLLDYPFAYRHDTIKDYIDYAVFIDTPLDVAMARRVLRDFKDATAEDIRNDMDTYLKYARIAYIQMLKDILPSSDYVIDGTKEIKDIVDEIIKIVM